MTTSNSNSNSNTLHIHTVSPALKLGEQMISADKRGKELSDSERIRRIVLPASLWNGISATLNTQHSVGLQDVLLAGLRRIASDRLKDTLTETPALREVPTEHYSIAALLAWNEESASSRGSITFTREDVEQWYPTSAVFRIMATKGQQWTAYIGNRLGTLAAKNHGLKKPEDAAKLITLLADDSSTALVAELISRLSHIERSLSAKQADALSLDDL